VAKYDTFPCTDAANLLICLSISSHQLHPRLVKLHSSWVQHYHHRRAEASALAGAHAGRYTTECKAYLIILNHS
jgi:hypothetical protein